MSSPERLQHQGLRCRSCHDLVMAATKLSMDLTILAPDI
jgi:hypothetical protein